MHIICMLITCQRCVYAYVSSHPVEVRVQFQGSVLPSHHVHPHTDLLSHLAGTVNLSTFENVNSINS